MNWISRIVKCFVVLGVFAAGIFAGGCSQSPAEISDEIARMDKGLAVILPGIEGKGISSESIRAGLREGRVELRIETLEWGVSLLEGGLAINQMNVARNREQAAKLALRLYEYQKAFPDRPVFLVGHSGGSGVAVFALEALAKLPDAEPIGGAILIASSLSAGYDLIPALKQTRYGMVTVSNPFDLAALGLGTAAMGNVDGTRTASAGRTGFTMRHAKLFKMPVTLGMLRGIRITPHTAGTTTGFVREYLAPWILRTPWPPPSMTANLKRHIH